MKNNFRLIQGVLFLRGDVFTKSEEIKKLLKLKNNNEALSIILEYKDFLDNSIDSGLTIKIIENKFKLVTKDDLSKELRNFYSLKSINKLNLSNPMIETLTIIAYSQPVTRIEIDFIRGVESISMIQKLIDLDLVYISGKSKKIGNPNLYNTTPYFLDVFNQQKITNLPEFKKFIDQKRKELSLKEQRDGK